MNRTVKVTSAIIIALATRAVSGGAPVINGLDKNNNLTWTYRYDNKTNVFALLQESADFKAWSPVFYDLVSTNVLPYPFCPYWLPIDYDPPTNPVRRVTMPQSQAPAQFYRVALQTNIPDPSLLVHLSLANDRTSGVLIDSSGHGNHAFRYATNRWPATVTLAPDGNQAAEFHQYADGTEWGAGDYAGLPGYPVLTNMPRATIAVWGHYYQAPGGNWANNNTATLLDASWWDTTGSWLMGRQFYSATTFLIYTNYNAASKLIGFPDDASTTGGDTGGWHYYVVTFDGTAPMLKGYFDGKLCDSSSQLGSATNLRVGGMGQYIAIGTWNHDGTPQFYDADGYPNCCWMNGAMYDIRIYNRVLSDSEVLSLYNSFDNEPPTVPTNVWARAAASSQIELRWSPATDNFYVAGYTVRRNGSVVGTTTGPSYVDVGLAAATQYSYTVEAFDGAGNRSGQSSAVLTNTPAGGSPVAVIVDDSDGSPWVNILGTWNFDNTTILPGAFGLGARVGTVSGGAQAIEYHPTLPAAGSYQVLVWYAAVGGPNFPWYLAPVNVPVDIVTGGVTNTVVLNQEQNRTDWFSLGTYNFAAGTNGYVRIRTDGTSGYYVMADAVQFAK